MLPRISLISVALVLGVLVAGAATAQAAAPGAVTRAATAVTQGSAVLHGAVNPRGEATQYWFEYGTTSALTARTNAIDAGNGNDAFEVDQQVTLQRPGTTYRFRIVARNASGTTQGSVQTFRTDSTPPAAVTRDPQNVTQTSATLVAALNNRGRAATYHFEWGSSNRYGQSTPSTPLPASDDGQTVTFPLTGLTADSPYHYRVVMAVGDTVVRGSDQGFRTQKVPNGLLLQSSANPARYGGGTDVFGVLAGSTNTGRTIRVQADPFPFDGSWNTVASGRTDSTGAYRIHVEPLLTSSMLRTVAETDPVVISQPITVGVRLTTSLNVGDRRVSRGQRVRFWGQVSPDQAGSAISIQNRRGNRWVTISRTRAGGASRFSTRVRITRTGKYRVVARPVDGGHVMGQSSSRYIRVGR